MNIEDFTKQMQALLAMQNDFNRIKSENMLFRQQLEDAKNREKELIEKHQKELFEISNGNIKPQEISENTITMLISKLEEWSSDIFYADDKDNDFDRTSESFDYIMQESLDRYKIIQQIQTLLEKSAGIE